MEQSFFGVLQSWFKKEYGADYGGRYIALLLDHTSKADLSPFRNFLTEIFGKTFASNGLALNREHVFRARNGLRRADLAVLIDNELRALIELKYRDRLIKGSGPEPAQLDDYLDYCDKNRSCRFLLLYREPQKSTDIASIKRAGQRLSHYTALSPYLRRSTHPASAMLYQYFQEGGLVLEPVNAEYLYRFLHRFMLPRNRSGRINITSKITEGPRQFQALLNNMRLFGADITPQLMRVTGKESARSATVDFQIHQRVSKNNLSALIADSSRNKYLSIGPDPRRGGEVDVWAQNAFSEGRDWLYVYYGFDFNVQPGKLSAEQYAGLNSPEIDRADDRWWYATESFDVRRFADPEKAKIDETFVRLIRSIARTTLRRNCVKKKSTLKVIRALTTL